MYNYLKEVAALITGLIAFLDKAGNESSQNNIPYSLYRDASNVKASAINAIIDELKQSANLRINNVSQRNLGRCYNEYSWTVSASYTLPEEFIQALRAARKIDDGQQFSIGDQYMAEDGLFERRITVTVDSSD